MVHLKVACGIRPAIVSFHNVANSPSTVLCDGILTGRTQAILPSPDPIERPAASGRVQHSLAPSGLEIRAPFGVVRIGVRLYLDMPTYRRIRFSQQDDVFWCATLFFFGCGKYPLPGAPGFKVPVLNPAGSFLGMPSYRPSPQH